LPNIVVPITDVGRPVLGAYVLPSPEVATPFRCG
jgi:hypothetical protein